MVDGVGAKKGRPAKPDTYTTSVSVPSDELGAWKTWLAQHGPALGYRSLPDFLRIAVREKQERDEERLLRLKSLQQGKGKDEGDWPKKS